MSDIIISGYYGFGNNGDEALLRAIISDIRDKRSDADIVVLSKTPLLTQRTHNVKSISRTNIFKISREMNRTRLLISGGGSLIQNATSTKSLLYYLGIIRLAKMCGARVMLYANGIGPVKGKISKALVKRVLNRVDYITLREDSSRDELKNLGVDKPEIKVTADPALNIAPCSDTRVDELLGELGIGNFFVVSARNWKDIDKWADELSAAVAAISGKYSMTPLFIPMHPRIDSDISRYAAEKTGGVVLDGGYGTDEILGLMSRAGCVIGMRLHSVIYALSAGASPVGIVYDPKVSAFFDYINNENYISIEDFSSHRLCETVDKAMGVKPDSGIVNNMKERARENAGIAINLL